MRGIRVDLAGGIRADNFWDVLLKPACKHSTICMFRSRDAYGACEIDRMESDHATLTPYGRRWLVAREMASLCSRLTHLSRYEQFAPGVYDNSALQLTDLEREVLELRSQDREQEMVEQAAKLVEPSEVSRVPRY